MTQGSAPVRRILHLSDLHFGRDDPDLEAPLVAAARDASTNHPSNAASVPATDTDSTTTPRAVRPVRAAAMLARGRIG